MVLQQGNNPASCASYTKRTQNIVMFAARAAKLFLLNVSSRIHEVDPRKLLHEFPYTVQPRVVWYDAFHSVASGAGFQGL
jgi:hypothetical protein